MATWASRARLIRWLLTFLCNVKKHDLWKAPRYSNESKKWIQIETEGVIAVSDWVLLLAVVPEAATNVKRIGELERESGEVGKF